MALPLIPFAVGVAVGAVAVFALKGTPAGAAIVRRARRVADEVGDRLSHALSREGGLVREHYPQAPADSPEAPADPPGGSSRGSADAARDPG
jgi:hypothetical protein